MSPASYRTAPPRVGVPSLYGVRRPEANHAGHRDHIPSAPDPSSGRPGRPDAPRNTPGAADKRDQEPRTVPPGWDIHSVYCIGHVEVGGRVSRCASCWVDRLTISRGAAPYGVSSAAFVASRTG